MRSFMEALDSFATEAEAVRKAVTVRTGKEAVDDIARDGAGYRKIRSRASSEYLRALTECARLISNVRSGVTSDWKLREAMSTSDFPILFGDLLYRQLLGNYAVLEPTYPSIATQFTCKDFRTRKFDMIDGGREIPESVKEYAPYPELSFTESQYTISVAKFGRRFGLSFEMIVNDDLNAFNSRPSQLAIGCRMMEEKMVTQLWIDANGPHATLFTAGNGNKLATNAPLSINAITAIMTLMSRQRDSDGNPIAILAYELVVPPALEVAANQIMNALEIQLGDTTSGTVPVIRTTNWLKAKLRVTVNPWIPIVAESANGDTTWAIFAKSGSGRPALGYARLQGRETPGMFMQDPDQVNLGGGDSDVMEGNFDNDAINYKTRHFFGTARFDPKMAYASNGSGVAD